MSQKFRMNGAGNGAAAPINGGPRRQQQPPRNSPAPAPAKPNAAQLAYAEQGLADLECGTVLLIVSKGIITQVEVTALRRFRN